MKQQNLSLKLGNKKLDKFGGTLVFGDVGSGKITGVVYPLLEQLIAYKASDPDNRIGGLVMDDKGDIADKTEEIAKKYGRENDIIRIRLGGEIKWNPIHAPHLAPEDIANKLLITLNDNIIFGSFFSFDEEWGIQAIYGIHELLTHAIGLYRLAYGYITIHDINRLIQETLVSEEE